ncbi:DUF2971 domain-containing protein [Aeromonas hydrophila]
MNILYKYYPSGLNIIDYLTCPTVKLSNVAFFNDPFELKMSRKHAELLANRVIAASNITDPEFKELYAASYEMLNSFHGIVSLTETHRNMLMWSHYADSHKGFCLGYKTNFLEIIKDKSPLPKDLKVNFNPQRMIYDSKRFDESVLKDIEDPWISICHALTKKSDEWIYEKEHRCILPIIWADKIKVRKILSKKTRNRIESLIKNKELKESKEKDVFYFSDVSAASKYSYEFSRDKDISLLKDINIESIKSIYLGCKFDATQINKLKNLVASNPNKYGHISLYKYEPNPTEFSLDLNPLSNDEKDSLKTKMC